LALTPGKKLRRKGWLISENPSGDDRDENIRRLILRLRRRESLSASRAALSLLSVGHAALSASYIDPLWDQPNPKVPGPQSSSASTPNPPVGGAEDDVRMHRPPTRPRPTSASQRTDSDASSSDRSSADSERSRDSSRERDSETTTDSDPGSPEGPNRSAERRGKIRPPKATRKRMRGRNNLKRSKNKGRN
jgi:hypothetical protein